MSVRYVKSNQIVERKVRDEQILVPIGGHAEELEALYNLNASAGVIWEAIGDGLTEEQMADRLVDQFDVDHEAALHDTRETLQELVKIGALQVQEEGSH